MKTSEHSLRRMQAVAQWLQERDNGRPLIVEGSPAVETWTVATYIREEVRRQGHNLSDPNDGGIRVK